MQNARSALRTTNTVVTHRDGRRTVERDGETIGTLPPPDVLPPALASEDATNDRKRLCIEPPEQPTWALPALDFTLPPVRDDGGLRIVTWNVWFAPHEADARMAALFVEALAAAPDVICLQEVVPELAESIRASAALRAAYSISTNHIDSYGVVVLARHALAPTYCERALPSRMGRSLLIAECRPSTPDAAASLVAVATVHLESLNNAATRRSSCNARTRPWRDTSESSSVATSTST